MSDNDNEWVSTTWDQIDAAVDTAGHREGFVKIFLEYRGAVLDDMPLDAKGRPEVVNQSNFARHFGIAISTFHRWLTVWGGPKFALEGERKERADAARGRQKEKAARKDRDSYAQEVRRKVAESADDYRDKLTVRKADDEFFYIDVHQLIHSDLPGRDKEREAERWLSYLDEQAEAVERAREELLTWITANAATDGTAAA